MPSARTTCPLIAWVPCSTCVSTTERVVELIVKGSWPGTWNRRYCGWGGEFGRSALIGRDGGPGLGQALQVVAELVPLPQQHPPSGILRGFVTENLTSTFEGCTTCVPYPGESQMSRGRSGGRSVRDAQKLIGFAGVAVPLA